MKSVTPNSADEQRRGPRAAGRNSALLPPVSPAVVRWFRWYSRRYLRRHFHSLRASKAGVPVIDAEAPLVIYLNHAAWWDPLVLLLLTEAFFPGRTFYAPMDAWALERYGFFRRIGCFGVELGSLRGARSFLETSQAVLSRHGCGLCMTPQGRFADVRKRPAQFEAGLGQLARRMPNAIFVPLALEYVFWEERLPEVLAHFGEPKSGRELRERLLSTSFEKSDAPSTSGATVFTPLMEELLMTTQDALARDSMSRDAARFRNLLSGRAGVGGFYDLWRCARCWLRGERFTPEHSSL